MLIDGIDKRGCAVLCAVRMDRVTANALGSPFRSVQQAVRAAAAAGGVLRDGGQQRRISGGTVHGDAGSCAAVALRAEGEGEREL